MPRSRYSLNDCSSSDEEDGSGEDNLTTAFKSPSRYNIDARVATRVSNDSDEAVRSITASANGGMEENQSPLSPRGFWSYIRADGGSSPLTQSKIIEIRKAMEEKLACQTTNEITSQNGIRQLINDENRRIEKVRFENLSMIAQKEQEEFEIKKTEQERKDLRDKEKSQLKGDLDHTISGSSSSPIDVDDFERKYIRLRTFAETHEENILRTVVNSEKLLTKLRTICRKVDEIVSSVGDSILEKETKNALISIFKKEPLCNRLLLGNNQVVLIGRDLLKKNGYLMDDLELKSVMEWNDFSWKERMKNLGLLTLYSHVIKEFQGSWLDDGLQWLKRAYLEMKYLDDLPNVSMIKQELDKNKCQLLPLGAASDESDHLVYNLQSAITNHESLIKSDPSAGCEALIAEFSSYINSLKGMNELTAQYWMLLLIVKCFVDNINETDFSQNEQFLNELSSHFIKIIRWIFHHFGGQAVLRQILICACKFMLPVFSSFQDPNMITDGSLEMYIFLKTTGDTLLEYLNDEKKNEVDLILQKLKFVIDSKTSDDNSEESRRRKELSKYIDKRLSFDPKLRAELERVQLNPIICEAYKNQKEFLKRNKNYQSGILGRSLTGAKLDRLLSEPIADINDRYHSYYWLSDVIVNQIVGQKNTVFDYEFYSEVFRRCGKIPDLRKYLWARMCDEIPMIIPDPELYMKYIRRSRDKPYGVKEIIKSDDDIQGIVNLYSSYLASMKSSESTQGNELCTPEDGWSWIARFLNHYSSWLHSKNFKKNDYVKIHDGSLGFVEEFDPATNTCKVRQLYLKEGAGNESMKVKLEDVKKCMPVLSAKLLNAFLNIGMETLIDYFGAEKIAPLLQVIENSILKGRAKVNRLETTFSAIENAIERIRKRVDEN